jgi:hypothetical protein
MAAVSGRSVRSLPSVSSVRRAMVSAPTATAAQPRRISGFSSIAPAPYSGAMALAMLEVPEEKPIRQPILTSTTVPTNSRRVVFGPAVGRGIVPERSSSTSAPSLPCIAIQRLMVG